MEKVFDALSVYKNPKIIKWNDYEEGSMSSLNWGAHKTGGYSWGFSVVSDGNISFTTTDSSEIDLYDELTIEKGFSPDDKYSDSLRKFDVDYSDSTIPYKVIQFSMSVLKSFS